MAAAVTCTKIEGLLRRAFGAFSAEHERRRRGPPRQASSQPRRGDASPARGGALKVRQPRGVVTAAPRRAVNVRPKRQTAAAVTWTGAESPQRHAFGAFSALKVRTVFQPELAPTTRPWLQCSTNIGMFSGVPASFVWTNYLGFPPCRFSPESAYFVSSVGDASVAHTCVATCYGNTNTWPTFKRQRISRPFTRIRSSNDTLLLRAIW